MSLHFWLAIKPSFVSRRFFGDFSAMFLHHVFIILDLKRRDFFTRTKRRGVARPSSFLARFHILLGIVNGGPDDGAIGGASPVRLLFPLLLLVHPREDVRFRFEGDFGIGGGGSRGGPLVRFPLVLIVLARWAAAVVGGRSGGAQSMGFWFGFLFLEVLFRGDSGHDGLVVFVDE